MRCKLKYFVLFAILIIIAGCSLKKSSSFSVEEINECIAENQQNGLDRSVEVCINRCNNDVPCEQRVAVIAKEKFEYKSSLDNKIKFDEEKTTDSNEAVKKDISGQKLRADIPNASDSEIENISNDEKEIAKKDDDQKKENKEDVKEQGLVNLYGFSCDNKEDLPDRMKVFVERVDIKKWDWIIPHGGVWELTELEPGEYKIYYAAERNTEPLAKYSEFMADGSDSHDYKILDLTSGGEVKDIKPCDWE